MQLSIVSFLIPKNSALIHCSHLWPVDHCIVRWSLSTMSFSQVALHRFHRDTPQNADEKIYSANKLYKLLLCSLSEVFSSLQKPWFNRRDTAGASVHLLLCFWLCSRVIFPLHGTTLQMWWVGCLGDKWSTCTTKIYQLVFILKIISSSSLIGRMNSCLLLVARGKIVWNIGVGVMTVQLYLI